MDPRRLLLVAPPAALAPLQPLIEAWRGKGVAIEVAAFDGPTPPDVGALVRTRRALDGTLLVGSARRAPATALQAPFAFDRDGLRVPVAWLPATSQAALRRFAVCAAHVQRRGGRRRALALLGQWHPRYLHVADRIGRIVDGSADTLRWTGDALTREAMLDALGCGVGLGIYVGHGRPIGWVGYHGVRAHHFAAAAVREPMGALLSLCCRTASRRRTGLSYAEALPLLGVAAASLGAVGDTLHTDNTRWAVGICDALAAGCTSVGDLLLRAAPSSPTALQSYRLIGDPLAPLFTDDRAWRRARRVPIHA